MKYFKRIYSLSDLKDQYRTLAIANHPDKGGDTGIMQEINAEFDAMFSIWKSKFVYQEEEEDQQGNNEESSEQTGKQYRKHFYTENGWEGVRYDSNLSTKDISARVRVYAKERWPEYKFSVRTQYYSGGSSIYVKLISGPEAAFVSGSEEERRSYVSTCRNVKGFDGVTKAVAFVVNDVCDYMASYNYDDSDGMIDYFDVNFYTHIHIGSWEKPYEIKAAKPAQIKEEKPVNPASIAASETISSIPEDSLTIEIVDYSEKAVAVFGDTKQIKDQLAEIGGRFNKYLTYKDGKRAGWIFPKSKRADIETLCHLIKKEQESIVKDPIEEREQMNDGAYMAFVSCVKKRLLSSGYVAARKYIKEKVNRYTMRTDQLRYIAFLLSDFVQRYGETMKAKVA